MRAVHAEVLAMLASLACGCGIVSGLDSLDVDDASSDVMVEASAEASDDAPIDVSTPDASDDGEAGPTNFALAFAKDACAAASMPLSLSGMSFSIAFWIRVVIYPQSDSEVDGLVWNGGRSLGETGWSVDVTSKGIEICFADVSSKCSTPYLAPTNDLVHIVITSATGVTNGSRTAQVYARDVSKQDATHAVVETLTGVANSWTTNMNLSLGAAMPGAQCQTGTNALVLDDVRIVSGVIGAQAIEASAQSECANGALVEFPFDEGSGSTTTGCTAQSGVLALHGATFVASPFF